MLPQFRELLFQSKNENRGLTFYVNGQEIAGLVLEIVDEELVIVSNQMHDRILIKFTSIDAVAL